MSVPRRFAEAPIVWLAAALIGSTAWAQFDSGSNGSDGALDFSDEEPGAVVEFDPLVMGIDADGDSIYHFTTITIPEGVTVKLRADKAGGAPIHWLAQGDVIIDGTLDLSGNDGHAEVAIDPGSFGIPSTPGPGGFAGGYGPSPPNVSGIPGFGPGAGCLATGGNFGAGGSAGHATAGVSDGCASAGGETYGNPFLLPLVGGSGGGGGGYGSGSSGSGGGAGGGAILIATTTQVQIGPDGVIVADGGAGGPVSLFGDGGGGSGGAIRLVATLLTGTGRIRAEGGAGRNSGGRGRVRVDVATNDFDGTVSADYRAMTLPPNPILLPTAPPPTMRIMTIAGEAAPARPTGSVPMTDVVIREAQSVPVVIESHHLPTDATVRYTVINEAEGVSTGTLALSPEGQTEDPLTWSADVTFPAGYSRIFTNAEWDPPAP